MSIESIKKNTRGGTLGAWTARLILSFPRRGGEHAQKRIPRFLRASRFLFIHVPKTGGVSISKAVYGRQVWHRSALSYLEEDAEFFLSRLSFAVVRNPWDRAVSAFEFSRSGGTGVASLAAIPPQQVLRSFRSFVLEYLLPNKDSLDSMDGVFRGQHTFVCDRQGKCLVNTLGRFEKMDELEVLLAKEGAIRRPIGQLNTSPTRVGTDYRRYYTSPDLVDAVATSYARDVSQFSYQFD